MTDDTLRGPLEKLQAALRDPAKLAPGDRERLRQLAAEIDGLLAKPGALTRAEHDTALGGLRDAITRFEVSHPDLTATVAHVSKALADMGI